MDNANNNGNGNADAMDLSKWDIVLINTSGGKDSQAMLDHVVRLAREQGMTDRLVAVHADLGDEEWEGTKELAQEQAEHYGVRFLVAKRDDTILDYVLRRDAMLKGKGKVTPPWPSSTARWCTSDFKRAPIRKVVTALVKEVRTARGWKMRDGNKVNVLNCMGLRAQESPARAKRGAIETSDASNGIRNVVDWHPILNWTEKQVWENIQASGVRHHEAYDRGMPRLSCCFCILASKSALVRAAQLRPELLQRYIEVEDKTGFTMRQGMSLRVIQDEARACGDAPAAVEPWNA